MAREYARYLTSTHRDRDWRALTALQHDAYMALTSCDEISWVGVVPYAPTRFVGFSSDMNTEKKVERTWAELADLDYLAIDRSAGEVLVRTFIKAEKILIKPNLTKAMISAYGRVRSDDLIGVIGSELHKIHRDAPDLAGWKEIGNLLPELFADLSLGLIEA